MKTQIYNAYHGDNRQNDYRYIDGKTNSEEGIVLYHHSSSSSGSSSVKIPWSSAKELHDYVKKHFGDDVTFKQFESEVKLNLKTRGHEHKRKPFQNFFHVKRFAYKISKYSSTSQWSLDFSIFRVLRSEDKISSSCRVQHTYNIEEFSSFCQENKDFQFSRTSMKGSSLEDISLIHKLKLKRIKKDDHEMNVNGESKMFRAKHIGVDATIKKISNMVGIATKYETLVASNQHDNISRFFGGETNEDGDLLFAFEHYPFVMYNYFRVHQACRSKLIGVMRGICRGVKHLHHLKLCHGNITPWKVMLAGNLISKLCGVGEDLSGIGKLIAYYFGDAYRTLAISTEKEYNDFPVETFLTKTKDANEGEAHNIASRLLDKKSKPPSFEELLRHPWLWDASRKAQFLRDASDFLREDSSFLKSNINNIMIFCGGWNTKFPKELVDHMNEMLPNTYEYYSVTSLLRFIRNVISHRLEVDNALKLTKAGKCVKTEDSLVEHLRTSLPSLLVEVYNVLNKNTLARRELPNYF